MTRLQHLKLWTAALLIRGIVHGIGRTCRVEVVSGAERAEQLRGDGSPVVISFWHNRAFFCAYTLFRTLLRRGYPITILVSKSRDGELGVKLARLWRAGVVRGSATRGGTEGLRQLYRAVRRGSAAITIPDGPHGPVYECKPGAVVLAQMSGVPILPMAYAASSAWTLKSWDRMIIPKPFARIRVAFGELLEVPREMSAPELDGQCQRLKETLNRLVQEVETLPAPAT